MKAKNIDSKLAEQAAEKSKKRSFARSHRRNSQPLGIHVGPEAKKHIPAMELFQREDCTASHSVRTLLSRMGLDYIAHNVTSDLPLKHKMLVEAGGKDQIPFLVDHSSGVKLYGASPIRAYVTNEYGAEPATLLEDLSRTVSNRFETQSDRIVWALQNARDGFETLRGTWQSIQSKIKSSVEKFRADEETEDKAPQSVQA